MSVVIVVAVLFAVVFVISAPLRRERVSSRAPGGELAELEAAREAKYREIRDAELDHRTGKLSDADYDLLNTALRGEAIEILRRIDEVRDRPAEAAPTPSA